MLSDAIGALHTLQRMVRDLLDVNQSQTGNLAPREEAILVEDLVARIVRLLRPFAADPRLVVRSDLPSGAVATIDANLFSRVVENLVANAFKYAPPESEVTTVLSLIDPSVLRVVVSDGGPGIPPEAREKIFDPGYRLTRDAAIPGAHQLRARSHVLQARNSRDGGKDLG